MEEKRLRRLEERRTDKLAKDKLQVQVPTSTLLTTVGATATCA